MKEKLESYFYKVVFYLEKIFDFSSRRNFKNVAEKIFGNSETELVEKKTVGFNFGDEPYIKSSICKQPTRVISETGTEELTTTQKILDTLEYSKIGGSYILWSSNKELTKGKEIVYQGTENLFSKNFFKSQIHSELLKNRAKNTTLFMVLALYLKSISKKPTIPKGLRNKTVENDSVLCKEIQSIRRAEKLLGHLTKPFKN